MFIFCVCWIGTDTDVLVKNDHQIKNPKDLSGFMQQWKQWTSKRISREIGQEGILGESNGMQIPIKFQSTVWQEEFFDHLLRSQESFEQKWDYVSQNPVRKGLVRSAQEWPWQGEIFEI
jgi:REP element-mobilizing transposase RayT